MTDELLKRLLIEIVVNADDALSDIKQLRSATEQLKIEFKDLQAKTGESFGIIQASVNKITLDPIKNEIKETKIALAGLNAELKALGPTKFGGIEAPSSEQTALLDSIAAKQAELVTLQQQLSVATRASTAAFSELKRESAQINAPILSAKDAATQFTTNVAAAKQEILELIKSGNSLDEALEGVRQTGQYTGKELTKAMSDIKKATLSASEASKLFDKNVASAKQEILALVSSGSSLRSALHGVAQEGNYSGKELSEAFRQASGEMNNLGQATSKTARIMERIFAAAIIGVVLNAVRSLINELKELSQEAQAAGKEFVQFVIEIRNAQAAGLDTTIQEWTNRIDELGKRFTQFTQQELQDGVGKIIRLGRQIGLTDAEITSLIDKVALFATVTGKDLPSAIDATVQAITRGRLNETVVQLFGGLDAPTLNTEAVRRGLAETTEEVTQYTRYLLLMQKAEEEATTGGENFALVQEHISGQVKEAQSDLVDLRVEVGNKLLPAKLAFYKVVLLLATALGWLYDKFQTITRYVGSHVIAVFVTAGKAISYLLDSALGKDVEFNWVESFKETQQMLDEWGKSMSGVAEEFEDSSASIEMSAQRAIDAVEEMSEKIQNAIFKIQEMVISLENAVAKELRNFENQVAADVAKFALKMQQLVQKLHFDIAQANRQFNDKVAEANDDYRDNEVKAEEDHQEKLRKLREQFLFNLEDALRERDARQIIRLIREYNLKRDQLNRERVLEQEDNKRKLEDQISDLRAQRDARIRELELEAQFRSSQMQAQFALEQDLRKEQHKQRVAEIRIRAKERLDAFLRELVESGDLTIAEAKLIADAFDMFFGPEGQIEGSIEYLTELLKVAAEAAMQAINRIKAAIAGVFSLSKSMSKGFSKGLPPIPSGSGGTFEKAEGGTHIVTRPTYFVAGEAGPELAEFTPLNRTGRDVGKLFSDTGVGRGHTNPSRVVIGLEDGLIANIVDSAVGAAGSVIIDIQRVER